MGKKFACIKYFSTPGSQDGVARLNFTSKTLEINLTTIKLKIRRRNGKTKRLDVTA
jgi:hypothetical protein